MRLLKPKRLLKQNNSKKAVYISCTAFSIDYDFCIIFIVGAYICIKFAKYNINSYFTIDNRGFWLYNNAYILNIMQGEIKNE